MSHNGNRVRGVEGVCLTHKTTGYLNVRFFLVLINFFGCFLSGHAHLTDFNIATIIKDGERATALAGTKPYMGNFALQLHRGHLLNHVWCRHV